MNQQSYTFPITKDELNAISKQDYGKLFEMQVAKHVEDTCRSIAHNVVMAAQAGNTTYTHKNFSPIIGLSLPLFAANRCVIGKVNGPNGYTKNILPDILENLKIKFPGISILTDPLQTYIHISWSDDV